MLTLDYATEEADTELRDALNQGGGTDGKDAQQTNGHRPDGLNSKRQNGAAIKKLAPKVIWQLEPLPLRSESPPL